MAEQDYATVSGEKVHRSDFAYAPAGSEPHEWKLPIHDASHVRNALARFNQTELPAGAKKAAYAKIMRAARKYGIHVGKERSSNHESRPTNHCIAVVLTSPGAAVGTPSDVTLHGSGTQLREIAVAVPGSWVKGDRDFSISKEDLADMVRNFDKRKNDMIVVDYEHASEQPEVAKGGPVPGAGWIHGLSLVPRNSSFANDQGQRTKEGALCALVEWTPQAEEMLRTGQYRFFSPAIDWGATDKETGEPQGATLTSGALTNHPFLEELPPIMLFDGTVIGSAGLQPGNLTCRPEGRRYKGAMTMAEKEKERERLEDPEEELAEREEKDDDGDDETLSSKHELPMLKIRKGRKGSKHEGHHILSEMDGSDVGCMSEEDLRAHAAKHLGMNPDEAEDREQDKEEASELRRRSLILTEVTRGGKIDSQRAIELADRGKITFADYIRAQEAEKMIDSAVREGKILPRHRSFFFADALTRPAEFAEYLKQAPAAVKLDTVGFGSAERGTPDQEIDLGVKKLMRESKLDYAAAFKEFLAENPVLADQYRRQHSPRVNADGTAN